MKEYFQFLRGAGKHRPASTLQLADAYNRLFFDPTGVGQRYGLAASWFPLSLSVGVAPTSSCPPDSPATAGADHNNVRDSLCDVFSKNRKGTASRLSSYLNHPDLVVYGGKTGTPQSLGPYGESWGACVNFNIKHTIPGTTDSRAAMKYHMNCGTPPPDDSLFVAAFGVRDKENSSVIPLTLALQFAGVETGFAVLATSPFLELIKDYFDAN